MPEDKAVTARIVYNCSVGNFQDKLVVLTLRVGTEKAGGDIHYEDMPFSLDRRVAGHLLNGLAKAYPKLRKEGTEH